MGKPIGIDLGTTFSAIAYLDDDGKAKVLRNRDGENITPSVVNFDQNGEPLVGKAAKDMSVEYFADTVMYVKRHMGEEEWSFPVGEKNFTPEVIASFILKRLKEDAESILGETVEDVVITVPAYFGDAHRNATMQAGKIAGLNVLKVINEPTAAALAYGSETNKDETVLVYDLGGGTFDVTIMKINKDRQIEVIATGGDKNLGGFDWDNSLITHLHNVILTEHGVDFFETKENGMNQLRKLAESAKIALSDRVATVVNVDLGEKGRIKIDITRELFNELTETQNRNTIDMTLFTLEDANLNWSDIDKILLVGGSTRMPVIREMLEKEAGKKPSAELHPDEVVAMGAALQAAICLQQKAGSVLQVSDGTQTNSPICLPPPPKDVCSHSLGVQACGSDGKLYNAVVMPLNTSIPGKKNEEFATQTDNQTSINVVITEGEGDDLKYVTTIGECTLKIDPYPAGAPLDVVFEYDDNQIIHVNVYDKTKKKHLGEILIERKANLSDKQVEQFAALVKNTQVG